MKFYYFLSHRKTLVAAEKAHLAHREEVEKYESDLHEAERLRKEYEDKLHDESQHSGRNLALEENQVGTFFIAYRKNALFDELDARISTIKGRSSEENDTIF